MPDSVEVSAIIPTFNRKDMLLRAIGSVRAQTHRVDEIVIVDDGSSDGTREAVERLGDERIRYVWQPNSGVSAARNRGMSIASGRYFALLDSDDLWAPEKTRLQLDWLRPRTGYGMVLCDVNRVTADGELIDVFRRRDTIRQDGWVLRWIIHNPALAPASALFRREVYEDVGGFDESLRTAEDLDFHLRVAEKWQVGVVPEPLVQAMRGHDGLSSTSGTYQDYVRVVESAVSRCAGSIPARELSRALSGTYARNARGLAISGEWRQSIALLRKAMHHAVDRESRRNVASAAMAMAKRAVASVLK